MPNLRSPHTSGRRSSTEVIDLVSSQAQLHVCMPPEVAVAVSGLAPLTPRLEVLKRSGIFVYARVTCMHAQDSAARLCRSTLSLTTPQRLPAARRTQARPPPVGLCVDGQRAARQAQPRAPPYAPWRTVGVCGRSVCRWSVGRPRKATAHARRTGGASLLVWVRWWRTTSARARSKERGGSARRTECPTLAITRRSNRQNRNKSGGS